MRTPRGRPCEDCGACCLIQPVEAEQGAEPLTPRKVRSDGKVNAPGETVLDEVCRAIDAGSLVVVFEEIHIAIGDTQQGSSPGGGIRTELPACELVAQRVFALDERPPREVGLLEAHAGHREAIPVDHERLDPRRRVLELGLAGNGSTTGLIRAPTRASEAWSEFQWIGDENGAALRFRRWCARARPWSPRRVQTRASSPRELPTSSASCACMSTNGSGRCSASAPSDPCESSCATGRGCGPVLRTSGKSSSARVRRLARPVLERSAPCRSRAGSGRPRTGAACR